MKESWRFDAAYRLISLSSWVKVAIACLADLAILTASAFLAFSLVHDSGSAGLGALILLGTPLVVTCLFVTGAYRAVTRFIGMEFVERGAFAILCAVLTLNGVCSILGVEKVSWNLSILFGLIGFSGLVLNRLLAKRFLRPVLRSKGIINVLVYGAGDAGTQLASALNINSQYRPVGFIDDRHVLHGRTLLGLPVYSPEQLPFLKERDAFERVLLAMPSASRARRRSILEYLESLAVKVLVMPGMDDLASGSKRVDELREVQIQDLLERDPVAPVDSLLDLFIKGKSVMVTGAGGSIGSELCRQVVKQGARRLVLFEVSEYALYKIDRELCEMLEAQDCQLIPVLGSILDQGAVGVALQRYQVETVYHAAAYKHVPLVEGNIISAVRNNVLGTLAVLESAAVSSVRNFVLVSTDKAVRPTNVMGASKRVCELIVQAYADRCPQIRMSMVRFGNVLASSGSVVPLFNEQILRGGPVTVTHPEITRYFMTIPEAAQLVIQAGSLGQHGEVFVLDMGRPVKIRELAERMIRLSGLKVVDFQTGIGDIEIQYTGLRPGEKLYEELLIGENPEQTPHARIFKAREQYISWTLLKPIIDQLCASRSDEVVVQLLESMVTGFKRSKNGSIPDAVVTVPGKPVAIDIPVGAGVHTRQDVDMPQRGAVLIH